MISQFVPEYPGGHAHEQVAGGPGFKTFTPPLLQTNGSHGVISQLVPLYPAIHVQVYVPSALSAHVPPLTHGAEEHGVISQFVPEYPVGQVQV